MQHTPKKHYKALTFIGMLFVTISLSSFALAYKVITIGHIIYSAAALIIPFRYLIGDIVAEVYGFYMAKRFIWYILICGYVFSGIINGIIYLPSPPYWTHQSAYDFVLGNTLRVALDASLGIIIGSMLNIYLISKKINVLIFLLKQFTNSGVFIKNIRCHQHETRLACHAFKT